MARKKSKANYFTKETEEYIVKYNESTDNRLIEVVSLQNTFTTLFIS